ncbi:MAG: hypothetical protein FJ186_01380 [Gammaproteobacteria bacterium]|nr:hypothetical protein [Gammaproteobacteria bacterium]
MHSTITFPKSPDSKNHNSSNPLRDFFSSLLKFVLYPIGMLYSLIMNVWITISRASFIKNCQYVLFGTIGNHQKEAPQPSIASAEDKIQIHRSIWLIIITCLIFSALMYTNIFIYKNFLDAFGSGNKALFDRTLVQYAIVTILLSSIRALAKYLRKTTQSQITKNIRDQWFKLVSQVNLDAFLKREKWQKISQKKQPDDKEEKKTQDISQLIQEEVDDVVSYSIVTITQLIYMTLDALFFAYFLLQLTPGLFWLALITTAISSYVLIIPGRKQLETQGKYRKIETKLRSELAKFKDNQTSYKNANIQDSQIEEISKLMNEAYKIYNEKMKWESIYSWSSRTISYLAIPAALMIIAPGFSSGIITFGVVMSGLRCFKDFLNSIMLINDNQKMFNKFETGVNRLTEVASELNKQKQLEEDAKSNYVANSKEITLPDSTMSIYQTTDQGKKSYTLKIDQTITLAPGIHHIKGPSGSGKSLLLSAFDGTFFAHETAKISDNKKIGLPYAINSPEIFHHTQNSRNISLIDNSMFTADQLIRLSSQTKDELQIPKTFCSIVSLSTPFKTMSGGQKDCISLITLEAIIRENPKQLPFKLLILDEVDQGFGCTEKEDLSSQVAEAFKSLFAKLEKYKSTLITLVVSHKLEQLFDSKGVSQIDLAEKLEQSPQMTVDELLKEVKSRQAHPLSKSILSNLIITPDQEGNGCQIKQVMKH